MFLARPRRRALPAAAGRLAPERHVFAPSSLRAQPQATRINMLTAIRRTLDVELAANRACWCSARTSAQGRRARGDARPAGQVRGGARIRHQPVGGGDHRTGVGMALAGLLPVAEIQFRKYADPAAEQLNDCGTLRWRTHGALPPRWWCACRAASPSAAPLAQPDQRGRVGARRGLAGGECLER